MGIPGLLQFIKDAAEPINVKKYRGQTVAVDTYCWLHKGAFSCAEKLAKGEPTDQYVWYCMKFVDMLLTFRVKPILVFDGRNLPSKQEVEKARRERRTANLQRGRQLLREGKVSEARECFTRSVSITPAMAHRLIKAARARGVDCIVAPYEADAQLAYLTKCHLAQAVITEDSDLLAFGCKKVILKMDKHGNGLEVDQSNLGRCRSLGDIFTEEKFRHMCILSGCDYLPSLHGIGLGKACKLLRLAKEPDILKVIRKMAQYLKMNLVIPEQYVEGFVRANNTFLYQLVFDPVRKKVVPLNPYPDHVSVDTLTYAGCHFEEEIELQLAMGNLDIESLQRIDDFHPDKSTTKASKGKSQSWNEPVGSTGPSIWSRDVNTARPSGLSPQPATSPGASSFPQRKHGMDGLRSPCRELQVKRSREEGVLSDQDILLQYCGSREKRLRSDRQPARAALARQPPNRFATLLQRRNRDAEEDGEDTCSRFFSSCSSGRRTVDSALKDQADSPTPTPTPTPSLPTQSNKSGASVACLQDAPSPPPSHSLTSPRPASQGFRLFDWPSNVPPSEPSGNLKLRSGPTAQRSASAGRPARDQAAASTNSDSSEDPPDSPLSQDSAYWSQSQPHKSPYYKKEEAAEQEEAACETSLRSEPEQHVPPAGEADEKPKRLTSKLPGLSKSGSSSCCPGPKTKTLGPARVSGLRKKAAGSDKKTSTCNNENRPGFQATISSLWKNFSFQKNGPVRSPCEQ